ncbi:hypothetical protein A0H81_14452 [Grifola frondosa]|uniref:Uncharacterized protein n=1 Tax=Grifola frondosa TaxID=5627 RepID=A0A1C7LLH6_GRIFR|nr:hypothetical protein A0H81_14452 [Grifola frondosa]
MHTVRSESRHQQICNIAGQKCIESRRSFVKFEDAMQTPHTTSTYVDLIALILKNSSATIAYMIGSPDITASLVIRSKIVYSMMRNSVLVLTSTLYAGDTL